MKWSERSPEERKEIIKKQQERKAERVARFQYYEAKRKLRDEDDSVAVNMRPGDYMMMREGWGQMHLAGKVCRFVEWDDDGHNIMRAGRNLKVIVEVSCPESGRVYTTPARLGGFRPVNSLRVLAEMAE